MFYMYKVYRCEQSGLQEECLIIMQYLFWNWEMSLIFADTEMLMIYVKTRNKWHERKWTKKRRHRSNQVFQSCIRMRRCLLIGTLKSGKNIWIFSRINKVRCKEWRKVWWRFSEICYMQLPTTTWSFIISWLKEILCKIMIGKPSEASGAGAMLDYKSANWVLLV